jgi:hypothetical protein
LAGAAGTDGNRVIYLSGATHDALVGVEGTGFMATLYKSSTRCLGSACWGADTGCYTQPHRYSDDEYLRWLDPLPRATNLFATAPDLVADWAGTIGRSASMLPRIRALGYRAALVAQDGLPPQWVAWDEFDALFVGGTTAYKLSEDAYALVAEAKRRGKWCHMGRVNSLRRLRAAAMGGYDSVDGTFLAFGPDVNLPRLTGWLDALKRQPGLAAVCGDGQRMRNGGG